MELEVLLQVFLDEKNNRDLIKYALTFTGSLDDATDLVSDLLIKIYTDERMKNAEEPMAYFMACIRNLAYNKMKRDKRLLLLPYEDFQALNDGIPAPQETNYEDRQTRQEIREMLSQYKAQLKEAFILFHLDGYSIKELAKWLNMSENALSQQFRRMRKKIENQLNMELDREN